MKNQTQMAQKQEKEFLIPEEITEHPFVDAIYRWFQQAELDAALYEEGEEDSLNWFVPTLPGYKVSHHLYVGQDSKRVICRTVVLVAQIPESEMGLVLEVLAKLNVGFACLYRFHIDSGRLLLLEFVESAENLSKGSYMNLLTGLFKWTEKFVQKCREEGVTLDPKKPYVRDAEEQGKTDTKE